MSWARLRSWALSRFEGRLSATAREEQPVELGGAVDHHVLREQLLHPAATSPAHTERFFRVRQDADHRRRNGARIERRHEKTGLILPYDLGYPTSGGGPPWHLARPGFAEAEPEGLGPRRRAEDVAGRHDPGHVGALAQ